MDLTFPALQALELRILNAWAQQQPVIIQAGVLAGKTSLAFSLGHKLGQMLVVAPTLEAARADYQKAGVSTHCFAAKDFDPARLSSSGIFNSESYVVIEDCFNLAQGELMFEAVTFITPKVLALGGVGKYTWGPDKLIWRFATWELNPRWSETELQQQTADPENFYRDYGK